MTPKPSSSELKIRSQLNELNACVTDAVANYRAVRDLAKRPWELSQRVTEALCAHYKAVQFKQRDPDPDEARQLTLDFLKRVEAEGLLLIPLDPNRPAAGLRLVDPQLKVLVAAAETEAHRAAATRDQFAQDHRALLNAADDQQKVSAVAAALEGSDPAALRAALDGLPASKPKTTNTLTTADLQEAALK